MKLSTVVVVAILTAGCGAPPATAPASTAAPPAAPADPLPSWNGGATKSAILDFVKAVTTDGSPDFRGGT